MCEIWKDIRGYEGLYQVSNLGRVRSLDRRDKRNRYWPERVLKSIVGKFGYASVHLLKDGVTKTAKVHRLVALMFIENPNNYKEVNHKDENKLNNSVDNLEWCTRSYNVTYGSLDENFRKRRVAGERNGRHRLTFEQVKEIRELYSRNSRDKNISKLAEKYGVSPSQIGNIVRNESWKGNYI